VNPRCEQIDGRCVCIFANTTLKDDDDIPPVDAYSVLFGGGPSCGGSGLSQGAELPTTKWQNGTIMPSRKRANELSCHLQQLATRNF
jgi:hypothetical protein